MGSGISRSGDRATVEERARTVQRVRKMLGRTQAELAVALGVSTKAVQSYEQGWRRVPVRTLIQLLVLLDLSERSAHAGGPPCWEVRNCDPDLRAQCPAFTMTSGRLCWFVGNRGCALDAGARDSDLLPCMSCPVVQRLLRRPETEDAGGALSGQTDRG